MAVIIQPFSGQQADLDYLFRNKTARILVGNPDQVAELVRCCPYGRCFTSMALSFNETLVQGKDTDTETLSMRRLLEIVNGVRAILAPEGQHERLAFLAVIHEDKGRTEVHVLIVNVDLATGRQYSPYVHSRDAGRLRNFQEYINASYGFTDPEDIDRQLTAMPDPRRGHFSVIKKITSLVQGHFQNVTKVNVDDVADYLESTGYRILRANSEGKKKRLAVVTEKSTVIRLPGVWFRADFDLEKFRSRKRKTLHELRQALMLRLKRFKELTAQSHRRKPIDFHMDQLPGNIHNPVKLRYFPRFFSYERWKDRKILILPERLFWGGEHRSDWSREIGDRLKFPILDIEQLIQSAHIVKEAPSIAVVSPKSPEGIEEKTKTRIAKTNKKPNLKLATEIEVE